MTTGLFAEKEWILLPSSPSLQLNNLSNNDKEKFVSIQVISVSQYTAQTIFYFYHISVFL